jgi:adenylyltransferase/sulfurtransferase
MIKVFIPTPLRKFTGGQSSVEVDANNVADAIASLAGTFPDLKQHLYDGENRIRKFLRIYVGEDDIQQLQGPETPLKSGDSVSIIPAIAGGKN